MERLRKNAGILGVFQVFAQVKMAQRCAADGG